MKKVKRIVSLMVAAIIVFATISPALASSYDVASPGPGYTSWEVFRVFHWVVRGDTLENIAKRWGTTPASIVSFNQEYFTDLAARNVTYGFAVGSDTLTPGGTPVRLRLEPGVKLHIYDVLRARHYVRRGDTLQSLTNPGLGAPSANAGGWFAMTTTIPRFRIENSANEVNGWLPRYAPNRGWFNDLWTLNLTYGPNIPDKDLVESDAIGAVYHVWYYDRFASVAAPAPPARGHIGDVYSLPMPWVPTLISGDPLGTPVFVTIPVRASIRPTGTLALPVSNIVYFRNPIEIIPWLGSTVPAHMQWENTFNPAPTNPALVEDNPPFVAPPFVGIWRYEPHAIEHFYFERLPIEYPFVFTPR